MFSETEVDVDREFTRRVLQQGMQYCFNIFGWILQIINLKQVRFQERSCPEHSTLN